MSGVLGETCEGGSLVSKAVQAVRAHIRENDLKVGDALPGEGRLASELGVSRAVMREAFGALAALNLIDVANGRRARVAAMDGSVFASSLQHAVSTAQISVSEIWDVRRTVEVRIAALAAEHRTEEQAQAIVRHAAAMVAAVDDFAEMTRHDIALHQAIAEAAGNRLFHQIVQSFAPLMEVAVPQAWKTRSAQARRDAMIERHQILADTIAVGNPAAAARAMDAHFDAAIGDLLEGDVTSQ